MVTTTEESHTISGEVGKENLPMVEPDDRLLMDSGAQVHMSEDITNLENVEKLEENL